MYRSLQTVLMGRILLESEYLLGFVQKGGPSDIILLSLPGDLLGILRSQLGPVDYIYNKIAHFLPFPYAANRVSQAFRPCAILV